MNSGERPIIVRARSPKAIASPDERRIATAEGSDNTMPLSWVYTSECAVPRSMAMRCQSISSCMAPPPGIGNSTAAAKLRR